MEAMNLRDQHADYTEVNQEMRERPHSRLHGRFGNALFPAEVDVQPVLLFWRVDGKGHGIATVLLA